MSNKIITVKHPTLEEFAKQHEIIEDAMITEQGYYKELICDMIESIDSIDVLIYLHTFIKGKLKM